MSGSLFFHLCREKHFSQVISGKLQAAVTPGDMVWTVEDKTLLITLVKVLKGSNHCWPSLFEDGQFSADLWTLDQMQKQLTRERFQRENPGMDFSGAEVSGNYQNGGPDLPS